MIRILRANFLAAVLGVLGILTLSTSACLHPPASVVTPQGKTAYTADQIVIRVNELQNTAIQANASGALTVPQTRIVVQFCVDAATVLKTTPAGWQQTVAAAWVKAKAQIPAAQLSNPAVAAAVSGVDIVLAAFLPAGGGN